MHLEFEELDYQTTPLGELLLRRRIAVEAGGRAVFEVKLNDDYLMSSLFHDAEVALAQLGLAELPGAGWDVVVGGLGLGFTAAAVLAHVQVENLTIVEALAPVIDWHQRALVPNGEQLSSDARCRYHHADFFELVRTGAWDSERPGYACDAVLLDIDHTPDALLNPSHADFYSEDGVRRLHALLKPGGVFAMWSNEAPDARFLEILERVFDTARGHVVEFRNPVQGGTASNGIYVATRSA